MSRKSVPVVLISLALFLAPASIALARQSWQTEAGSLAPLVLCLGGWALTREARIHRALWHPGNLTIWAATMGGVTAAYVFASLIEMTPLMALAAWAGGVATFYAAFGAAMLRRCAVPLAFLGLVVPLPYVLAMQINLSLRDFLSDGSVALGSAMGLDTARDGSAIAIGPYLLSIDNACAGANSTLSLVAIGLLFAHWSAQAGSRRAVAIALMALPIAVAANLLRVLALLMLVSFWGAGIIETSLHPLSGMLSFSFALLLLLVCIRIIGWSGAKPSSPAGN